MVFISASSTEAIQILRLFITYIHPVAVLVNKKCENAASAFSSQCSQRSLPRKWGTPLSFRSDKVVRVDDASTLEKI
jgi:hypothetical protein